jgi:hypothetical protein
VRLLPGMQHAVSGRSTGRQPCSKPRKWMAFRASENGRHVKVLLWEWRPAFAIAPPYVADPTGFAGLGQPRSI